MYIYIYVCMYVPKGPKVVSFLALPYRILNIK